MKRSHCFSLAKSFDTYVLRQQQRERSVNENVTYPGSTKVLYSSRLIRKQSLQVNVNKAAEIVEVSK